MSTITFSSAVCARLREAQTFPQSTNETYLIEVPEIGIGTPLIKFNGPWLILCGYGKNSGPDAKEYEILGLKFKISDDLMGRLNGKFIDEKTVWDSIRGLSYTGMYARDA